MNIAPFRAFRYDAGVVGPLENVITQPYDKISPEMLKRYLSLSPYNLANIIKNTDYARAAEHLRKWMDEGVLKQDASPAIYAYDQTYTVPGEKEQRTRKGFIALGKLEPYSAGVVYPHERTLTGPKQDRLQLLRATRMHFGQIFMLYPDPQGEVERVIKPAPASDPVGELNDEYGVKHAVWRLDDPKFIQKLQKAMAAKKVVIADGHHRYETALAFRDECRAASPHSNGSACDYVMMTFISMDAPGLTILPTHRLVTQMPGFNRDKFLQSASRFFEVIPLPRERGLREMHGYAAGQVIGAALAAPHGPEFWLMRVRPEINLISLLPDISPAHRKLDVIILHQVVLKHCLGIDEEAVREERFLEYVREPEKAWDAVSHGAPACFFLNPVHIEQMRDIAFAGGVMPQKSTDFYPKMLSGLTGYRVDD